MAAQQEPAGRLDGRFLLPPEASDNANPREPLTRQQGASRATQAHRGEGDVAGPRAAFSPLSTRQGPSQPLSTWGK